MQVAEEKKQDKIALVADDSKTMRQMLSFTLEQIGFSVVQAVDGLDAFEKLQSQHCNLVILDINMPNMDGLTLIKTLRLIPEYKDTPIFILTSDAKSLTKQSSKEVGATGWIAKPFNPEQLVSVVENTLKNK